MASAELTFEAIHQMPKPAQPGGVPLWISGRVNPAVARRLARFGAGWIPWGDDAIDVVGSIGRMRAAVAAAAEADGLDCDPGQLGVAGQLPEVRDADGGLDVAATMAGVPALVGGGRHRLPGLAADPERPGRGRGPPGPGDGRVQPGHRPGSVELIG